MEVFICLLNISVGVVSARHPLRIPLRHHGVVGSQCSSFRKTFVCSRRIRSMLVRWKMMMRVMIFDPDKQKDMGVMYDDEM